MASYRPFKHTDYKVYYIRKMPNGNDRVVDNFSVKAEKITIPKLREKAISGISKFKDWKNMYVDIWAEDRDSGEADYIAKIVLKKDLYHFDDMYPFIAYWVEGSTKAKISAYSGRITYLKDRRY